MSHDWKQRLDNERAAAARRKSQARKLPLLTEGGRVFYNPRDAAHPYAGAKAQVVRAPRKDVATPSVRVQFTDGVQLTVPVQQVGVLPDRPPVPPAPEAPAFLADARSRPVWKRIVKMLVGAAQEGPGAEPLRWDAEERVRQLAGTVAPRGSDPTQKADMARVLLEAAQADAVAAAARQPGRDGRGPVAEEVLPDPTLQVQAESLDQRSRALINNIARCIHKRYFLSDAEAREEAQVSGVVRRMIALTEREVGTNSRDPGSSGKGNVTAGLLHDSLLGMYQSALEACNLRAQGDVEGAEVMEREVQDRRTQFELANAEMERHRKKHYTGRYFHGEILSVREERHERDDEGMYQFYVRLVIVYDQDGHTPVVVNAREIEAATLVEVGQAGWAALGHWIRDLADREHGHKQGRRQDDDRHLIYRDNDGHLRPRPGISPELLRAFDAIRRAMLRNDVDPSQIPDTHPAPGLHLPRASNTPEERQKRRGAVGEAMENVMSRVLAREGLDRTSSKIP